MHPALRRPAIRALFAASVLTVGAIAPSSSVSAIYGGEQAVDEGAVVPVTSFPSRWSVGWCSGVLWKPRIVLTSAHCVVADGTSATYSTALVRVGRPGTVRGDGDLFYPTAIITPPDFINRTYVTDQDFAALVFDQDIGTTNVTRLATASEAASWAAAGTALDLVGYGTASPASNNPLVLRTSLAVSGAPVRSGYQWLELRATEEHGACPGDSGGGVLIRVATGERLLAGIIAGGRSPCTRSLPPYTTVAAMPVGFLAILDRALVLAGYPALPSAPTSVRAVSASGWRTIVSWLAPERNAGAVASYVVATPNGAPLCTAPAGATGCSFEIPFDTAGGLSVRAVNALGEIGEARVPVTTAQVRRLDGGPRQKIVSGQTYEVRLCTAAGTNLRLEEQRGGEWTVVDTVPSASRSPRCRAATPYLATFAWLAPGTGGRASRQVSLRVVGSDGPATAAKALVSARA